VGVCLEELKIKTPRPSFSLGFVNSLTMGGQHTIFDIVYSLLAGVNTFVLRKASLCMSNVGHVF
jgi:hypothetical protein